MISEGPNYFDSHSHLNLSQFDDDREAVIARMREEGVWTITIGVDAKTSKESVELAEKHDHIFATVGVHPDDLEEELVQSSVEGFDEVYYDQLVKSSKVVGIGEAGLDYFRLSASVSVKSASVRAQRELFEKQIEFAHKHKLPLMLHCRPSKGTMDAYEDVLDILAHDLGLRTNDWPGNVHFFVGDTEIAKKFLELGFTVSFDGPITFSRDYDEVVKYVPLDMILAETDAPYVAPSPYRGKRNEPIYVSEVVKAIAEIRGKDMEKVRAATVQNTLRVFGIKDSATM